MAVSVYALRLGFQEVGGLHHHHLGPRDCSLRAVFEALAFLGPSPIDKRGDLPAYHQCYSAIKYRAYRTAASPNLLLLLLLLLGSRLSSVRRGFLFLIKKSRFPSRNLPLIYL